MLKAIDRKSFERGNFLVLRPVLLKLHISTQLIDSFPLPYCPKSCDKEKLSIPVELYLNAQSSQIFLSFRPKIERAVIFYLLPNPAQTTYLSVWDG